MSIDLWYLAPQTSWLSIRRSIDKESVTKVCRFLLSCCCCFWSFPWDAFFSFPSIIVVPCMEWALPAPQGGTKTCTADGSGGFSCTMQCDSDGRTPYFLYDHIAGLAATQLVYTCTAGAAWDRGDDVPACIGKIRDSDNEYLAWHGYR